MKCGGSVVSEAAFGFNGCKVVSSILTGSAHLQPSCSAEVDNRSIILK